MKKLDVIIVVFFMTVGIVGCIFCLFYRLPGETVVVYHGNELYGEYPLDEERIISIDEGNNHNIIMIEDGSCYMSESNCSNQICVHEGGIRYNNESIYCAPNDIYIVVESTNNGEYDAITR